jgi:diadenosine tetraphosphatase ApaH/serine/threonine PP2A family protein phosphatase
MPDGTLVCQRKNAATSHTAHKTTTVAHRPMPRVAVISDVHANEQALLTVLEEIDAWKPEAIWCLGDVVGYGPAPNRCCQIVEERADVCLIGNHDLVALGTLDVADFNDEAAAAALWTRAALDERSRAFLSELVPSAAVGDVELFHASPRDPVWEYVLSAETAYVSLVTANAPLVLVGHSHVALAIGLDDSELQGGLAPAGTEVELEGQWLLNPGSVGQPRDGDPDAAWLELDTDARFARFHRVAYPIERTQAAIRERGLPDGLAERLAHGV